MNLTREEVLKRFCKLSALVARSQFEAGKRADCFCGQVAPNPIVREMVRKVALDGYFFDQDVVEFIEVAVIARLIKLAVLQPDEQKEIMQ
jgi:hypothetical protein